jgi:hypothetical protein
MNGNFTFTQAFFIPKIGFTDDQYREMGFEQAHKAFSGSLVERKYNLNNLSAKVLRNPSNGEDVLDGFVVVEMRFELEPK